jgi:uncharacterized membrane protein
MTAFMEPTWTRMTQRIQSAPVAIAPERSTTETLVPPVFLAASDPSPRLPTDLIIVVLLTLAATATSLLEAPPFARVPLGVLLVLWLPGYGIVSSLFASDDGPDAVARIALSVALSLATVPFVALAINWSPWRIERETVTFGLMVVALTSTFVAAGLRARLPVEERYAPDLRIPRLPPRRDWTRHHVVTGLLLCVAVALFVYGGFDAVKTRLVGEPTTEFSLFNASGEAQFYPRDIAVGDSAEVQVSIANHEGKRVHYELVITGAGRAQDVLPDLTLDDGETWQGPVRFTVTTAGENLPVQIELYRDDQPTGSAPYRLLTLIVHGLDPMVAPS